MHEGVGRGRDFKEIHQARQHGQRAIEGPKGSTVSAITNVLRQYIHPRACQGCVAYHPAVLRVCNGQTSSTATSPADVVLLVQVVWQRIHVRVLGHGLVERRVKHNDLRAQQFTLICSRIKPIA